MTPALFGTGIGRGIAIGPVVRMPDPLENPMDEPSTLTPDDERARVASALAAVAADMRRRAEQASRTAREILRAQALMAQDPTVADSIDARLQQGATAERAVYESFAEFREQFIALGPIMSERATDLVDLSQRAIAYLRGVAAPGVPTPGHPFVLVARDLAPADAAALDGSMVLALVTSDGGQSSHTSILARERSIVAVVATVGALDLVDGQTVIVDAATGEVIADPTVEEVAAAEERLVARTAATSASIGAGALADGTPIALLANLGAIDKLDEAVRRGAEGVGLFRTEFLFLDANEAPTIAEQQHAYESLFAAFAGKRVIVRTLDAGADKPLRFLRGEREDNPALGLRGLRTLRLNESILRDQLTAIAQAATLSTAQVSVMAPMVSTVEEARYFTRIAKELGLTSAGVMIEVPAAALLADRILANADFASVGTNDLTQFTLAADRQLAAVAALHDPWNPAVLRLVGEVGAAGAALDKPVGVCGEAAADPLLAIVLVGLGATSLSMAPSALAEVRAELRRFTMAQAAQLAACALSKDGAVEARASVRELAASLGE